MLFGDHWYITLGQVIIGCGVITLIIIALSTHIIARKDAQISEEKNNQILERVEQVEQKIKKMQLDQKDIKQVVTETKENIKSTKN